MPCPRTQHGVTDQGFNLDCLIQVEDTNYEATTPSPKCTNSFFALLICITDIEPDSSHCHAPNLLCILFTLFKLCVWIIHHAFLQSLNHGLIYGQFLSVYFSVNLQNVTLNSIYRAVIKFWVDCNLYPRTLNKLLSEFYQLRQLHGGHIKHTQLYWGVTGIISCYNKN